MALFGSGNPFGQGLLGGNLGGMTEEDIRALIAGYDPRAGRGEPSAVWQLPPGSGAEPSAVWQLPPGSGAEPSAAWASAPQLPPPININRAPGQFFGSPYAPVEPQMMQEANERAQQIRQQQPYLTPQRPPASAMAPPPQGAVSSDLSPFARGTDLASGLSIQPDRFGAGMYGFANANGPLQAIAQMFDGFKTGQRQDAQGYAQQQLALQVSALEAQGIPRARAVMMVLNPEFMKASIPGIIPTYEHIYNDGSGGAFNKATGERTRPYVNSIYQMVAPGQTGAFVTPPMPGAAGAKPPTVSAPVLSGGPQNPPPGFEYRDRNDPNKGLQAIEGGPATQLPQNTAGYLSMLQATKGAFTEAAKFFGKNFNNFSPINALGQTTGSFDIGRHQRSIGMAAEAALRISTGAAAPDSEVKRYADFYIPQVTDTIKTREQKLNALQRFMTAAETNMKQGRTTDFSQHLPPQSNEPAAVLDPLNIRGGS